MKLKISHVTEYHYDEPSVLSLQRLRLTPPTVAGQTILNWSLHVEGAKPEVFRGGPGEAIRDRVLSSD